MISFTAMLQKYEIVTVCFDDSLLHYIVIVIKLSFILRIVTARCYTERGYATVSRLSVRLYVRDV